MKKAFDGFENIAVTSVSSWVNERSCSSPILGRYQNSVIGNGVNTEIYRHYGGVQDEVKTAYGIPVDKKMVLFVTARFSLNPDDIKGGHFLADLAELMQNDDFVFVIVGSDGTKLDLPDNVINVGRVENQTKLAQLYSVADVSIVLSRKETFSMPCAESLCCGTPVVGFKAGGPESVSLKEYSEFCEYGEITALKQLILKWANFKKTEHGEKISDVACSNYDMDKMAKEYLKIYWNLLGAKKNG